MRHFLVRLRDARRLDEQLPYRAEGLRLRVALLLPECTKEPEPLLEEAEERLAAAILAGHGLHDLAVLDDDGARDRAILRLELDPGGLGGGAQDLKDVRQAEILQASFHDGGFRYSVHDGQGSSHANAAFLVPFFPNRLAIRGCQDLRFSDNLACRTVGPAFGPIFALQEAIRARWIFSAYDGAVVIGCRETRVST